MDETRQMLERVVRDEAGVVQGALMAQLRDLDLVEDAFADAVAAALEHWPRDGVPIRPAAWLLTAARRKALDQLRRRATRIEKQQAFEIETELASAAETSHEDDAIPDERLRLIFTCCHPELARPAQVALTLRALGGLSIAEIAHAFLVAESAMARRLVRAKAQLREARVPYQVPPLDELPARRDAVLSVLYLIFNEGYAASAGDTLVRRELCGEAIRLARLVDSLLPGDAELRGLLALMLLHDARRDARVDAAGVGVPLEEQDRGRWDRTQISEGRAMLAAIAEQHVCGSTFADTAWSRIVALYDRLLAIQPSPVVALNRAVAIGLGESPDAGLRLLDAPALREALEPYALYAVARADLLRRAGRMDAARAAYCEALEGAGSAPERAFLARRIRELGG